MKNHYFVMVTTLTFTLVFALFAFTIIQTASPQGQQLPEVKAIPSTISPRLGDTLTVDITVSNVENLYGLDVTLDWNNSVLEVQRAENRLGVDTYPDGVLYEILPDASIYIAEDNASQALGEYHLVATSVSPSSSFNGSGTIAIVMFKVIDVGHSELDLQSDLADRPPTGGTSNFIDHTDVGSAIDSLPEGTIQSPLDWTLIAIVILVVAAILLFAALALYMRRGKTKPKNP